MRGNQTFLTFMHSDVFLQQEELVCAGGMNDEGLVVFHQEGSWFKPSWAFLCICVGFIQMLHFLLRTKCQITCSTDREREFDVTCWFVGMPCCIPAGSESLLYAEISDIGIALGPGHTLTHMCNIYSFLDSYLQMVILQNRYNRVHQAVSNG